MADMISINKCELDMQRAELAATQYRNALHLFPMPESGWTVKVTLCSAYTKQGIEDLWNSVMEYVTFNKKNGYFYHKRQQQNLRIMSETIENGLRERFYNAPGMEERIEALKQEIMENILTPYAAADQLLSKEV